MIYLHTAFLRTVVTADQKTNESLASCLAQAEPVRLRKWRGAQGHGLSRPVHSYNWNVHSLSS